MNLKELKSYIRVVEDFPKKGISFKDITTLLLDKDAMKFAIDEMCATLSNTDFTKIVAPEARGFIVGMPVAYKLEKGFAPIRKPGKLPAETISFEYELEYGMDSLEIHKDAIVPGDRVVVLDDLLATGGTSKAICELIESLGAKVVKLVFLAELDFLNGREVLSGYDVASLIHFED